MRHIVGNITKYLDKHKAALRASVISFLALWSLAFLLVAYRFVLFAIEGGIFTHFFKDIRTLLAILQTQHELKAIAYAVVLFFIVINFIPRPAKKYATILSSVLIYAFVLYRLFNIVHVYYAGRHIDKDLISHIEGSSLGLLWDIRLIPLLAIPAAVSALVQKILNAFDHSTQPVNVRLSVLTFLFAAFSLSIWFIRLDRLEYPVRLWMDELHARYTAAATSPEMALWGSLHTSSLVLKDSLPLETARKISKFGIHIQSSGQYPMTKKWVYHGAFPYANRQPGLRSPNIIVLAWESLTASLVSAYNGRYPELTPRIDAFARESLLVRQFYNASSPTINGLVAMYCSHYPVYDHSEWVSNKHKMKFNLLCLPEALKERGYTSYDVTPDNPYYAGRRTFFMANGMDEMFGAMDISKALGTSPKGKWEGGCSDSQVIQFVIKKLQNREFKEPFTLNVSSIDFHIPRKMPDDLAPYKEGENDVLNLVHSVDHVFGTFWDYFKSSPYAGNTIVILTADHPAHRGKDLNDVIGEYSPGGIYEEIPLIIHDPVHRMRGTLSVRSSQVDMLPSILHMLGVNIPNPFEGLSIFGKENRPKYPHILGSHSHMFYIREGDKEEYFTRFEAESECDRMPHEGIQGDRADLSRCDYLAWWRYKRWLANSDLIWKN